MTIKLPGTVTVTAVPPSVPPPPELFWIASSQAPASCLWPRVDLAEHLDFGNPRSLDAFVAAVQEAVSRVLIIDAHFGRTGLASLWAAFGYTSAKVRVLTRQRKREIDDLLAEVGQSLPSNVEIRSTQRPFHDRFAVVDGDVWHFGSTVGGGYHQLSAASRGWHEHSNDLAVLFEQWWKS